MSLSIINNLSFLSFFFFMIQNYTFSDPKKKKNKEIWIFINFVTYSRDKILKKQKNKN